MSHIEAKEWSRPVSSIEQGSGKLPGTQRIFSVSPSLCTCSRGTPQGGSVCHSVHTGRVAAAWLLNSFALLQSLVRMETTLSVLNSQGGEHLIGLFRLLSSSGTREQDK